MRGAHQRAPFGQGEIMSDPKRVEAGRKGGIRSGEVRRKRRNRSFLDVLRGHVESDPERLVEQLLGSAAGAVVAARVLEKSGGLTPAPEREVPNVPGGRARGLVDVIKFAVRSGQEFALLGFELSDEQRAAVLAEEADPPRGDHGTQVPSRAPMPVLSEGPPETDLESHDASFLDPLDIPTTAAEDALMAAAEIHAHNRAELGLDEDDGNDSLEFQRDYSVARDRVDGFPPGPRLIDV
jgi:hypothetical protein